MTDFQKFVDQAYEEGKQAYKDGKNTEDNPYNGVNEDYQYDAWKEGYYNAAWDDWEMKHYAFPYLAYFGSLYYNCLYSPIKKVYMAWKFRKERKEVRRKYLKG